MAPGAFLCHPAPMDAHFAQDLRIGSRIVVYMSKIVSELNGTHPILTTATVVSEAMPNGKVWVEVDYTSNDYPLPQLYRVEEILGFLLPLAYVEHHADGLVTGTIPMGSS